MEKHKGAVLGLKDASADVILRAKAGDHGAFEEIYRSHVGRVYGICLRILADRTRAEDVTQQVFIRLWMKLGSFRGESSFGSWLHRLAVNAALNDLNSPSGKRIHDPISEDLPAESTARCCSSEAIRLDLEEAIAALPAQARVIFVLHDIEGLKHEDIADRLGLASGTCKAQLSRARKLLREALKRS